MDFDLEYVKEDLADVMIYCRNLLDEDEIINAERRGMKNLKKVMIRAYRTAFTSGL